MKTSIEKKRNNETEREKWEKKERRRGTYGRWPRDGVGDATAMAAGRATADLTALRQRRHGETPGMTARLRWAARGVLDRGNRAESGCEGAFRGGGFRRAMNLRSSRWGRCDGKLRDLHEGTTEERETSAMAARQSSKAVRVWFIHDLVAQVRFEG
ncbi:Alanine-glyoxylate aminotransferase 2-like [Sesbania bispinosa]|nr:Alanine-glyoxylate aminotransferase 2-like [Sesbania bispinosa]